MSIRILILALCLFPTSQTFAKPMKAPLAKRAPFSPDRFSWPEWNESEVASLIKSSEKKRKPANSSMIDESLMSKELKAIQIKAHSIKTSEGFDDWLNELERGYDKAPNDVKFYTTQIMPVKAFRGLFFRLKPLFDGKSNYVHSQILTMAKSLATKTQVFLPFDYAEAGYEFIATPYLDDKGAMINAFDTEEDVQAWLVNELLPLVQKSTIRLESLNLVEPIVWDQKMVFGPLSFQDGINRFKLIGEFEKNLSISSHYSSIASIATTRAYNVDNAIALYKEIGFLYGFDGFGFFNKIDGVSAEKVSKVMRKPLFAKTGTLTADGAEWMGYAYSSTKKAMKRLATAWQLSAEVRKDENLYAFNTGFVNVNRDEIEENLKIASRIVMSKETESLRSGVTGEVVQINYSKLFLSPPKDLKEFLPTSFDKNENTSRVVLLSNGQKKTLSYRNFAQGSAIGWNVRHFENYFPSVKSNGDVYKTVRVMNHIQGNWLTVR
jgi:hypothetical protein